MVGSDLREPQQCLEVGPKTYGPLLCWNQELSAWLEGALGKERFVRVSEALTTPPRATCVRVNTMRATQKEVVHDLERAAAATIRAAPVAVLASALLPDCVLLQGSGPHNVDYRAAAGREVIISRKAAEAVLRGAHVFVPGVLACSAGVEPGDAVAVCASLDSPRGRLQVHRGVTPDRAPGLLERSRLYVGLGRAQMARKEIFKAASGVAIAIEQPVFRTLPCNGLLPGKIVVQNLPSVVAAHVLGAGPGARVCDMCAAPGGKATAIAQLMRDEGCVIALDRSHSKVAQINSLAKELGLNCIYAHKMDATRACVYRDAAEDTQSAGSPNVKNDSGTCNTNGTSSAGKNSEPAGCLAGQEKIAARLRRKMAAATARGQPFRGQKPAAGPQLEAFAPGSFDYVLLDAPCSALGLRPRLQLHADSRLLEASAAYQRKLLQAAIRLLAAGGTLVYSTCTINPGENEGNVRHVLDRFPEMELVPQAPRLGSVGLAGPAWLSAAESALVQRFDPGGPADTIGFFIAKFRKRLSPSPPE